MSRGRDDKRSHGSRARYRPAAAVARPSVRSGRVAEPAALPRRDARFEDAAGKAVFGDGEIGYAHVRAHELFDRGHTVLGRAWLGHWLETHQSEGSQWVHLQFHQALFELADGDWDAAHARFVAHILPSATTGDDALTDAPALLWRLRLAAPRPIELPWQPLRARALAELDRTDDTFVELHHLLALAGAGDIESLDRWLRRIPQCDGSMSERVLCRMGLALRDYAARAFHSAGEALERLLPDLPVLGGSFAQQQLFAELARSTGVRARAA